MDAPYKKIHKIKTWNAQKLNWKPTTTGDDNDDSNKDDDDHDVVTVDDDDDDADKTIENSTNKNKAKCVRLAISGWREQQRAIHSK